MRWLLIALVVLLQMQMQVPGGASAQAAAASCHSAPAEMTHEPADADHDRAGKPMHMCPGCSIPGEAPYARPAGQWRCLLPAPAAGPALIPHSDPPMVPPPRTA